MAEFFGKEVARVYDDRNQSFSPIRDCMLFLIDLVCKNVKPNARVLCIGVGTGTEIIFLANKYHDWTFVAVDPSQAMLDVCQEKLKQVNLLHRCEFIHGYVQEVPSDYNGFDVVLSLLVAHFVKREEKDAFFKNMCERLVLGGQLITSEVTCDFD